MPGAAWGRHSVLLLEGAKLLPGNTFDELQASIAKVSRDYIAIAPTQKSCNRRSGNTRKYSPVTVKGPLDDI